MSQQRHLAAILFTDIVGYTAMMQENEQKAVSTIRHYNTSLNTLVTLHEGRVLNYYGDGSLCTFPSPTEALKCAMALQYELRSAPAVPLRIGLHIGEVFFEDGQVLGDGVNITSRIQSIGQENSILFSKEIYDKIKNQPEFKSVPLGSFDFKNVHESVEIFALANEGLVIPKKNLMSGKLKVVSGRKKNAFRNNMIMGIFAAVLSAAAVFFYLKYSSHQEYPVEKSIAVLPFVNNSNDPQQDYFADGMMDEILNHLYKVGGLRVISRTSSLTYKNSHKTSTEIANELGVANLLEGSVQKDGDHIRIIAQLINGKTDDHLWAETYVREFKDIFTIQSDIAQQITAALKIKIDPMVKQRIESKPTSNTEAYSLYLRASSMGLTMETSVALLEAAITLDSNFANAYAALAIHWLFRGGFRGDLTPQEVLRNALPMAQKALELNPDLAEAHQVLASINLWYKWDFESAGNEFNIIRRLNPSNPQTTLALTDYLLASGKFREALEISSTAYEKDSTSNLNRVTSAVANYFYGNVPVALQIISKSFTLSPDFYTATNFIRLHVYAGEYKKALLGFDKKRDLYGLNLPSLDLAYAAAAYYHTGHVDSTQQIIQLLKQRNDQSSIGSPSFCLAIIYSSMGENEQGIQWLQNAYKSHEVEMYWLNVEPPFKSLHSDPRFKELLGLIGFK